jgi:hypothetical protein
MRGALGLLVAAAVAACSAPSLPPPLQGGETTTPMSPSAAPSAGRSGGSPSDGEITAPEGFSEAESSLFVALREDAQVNCAPRREDLPPKSTAGVECILGTDLVERIGVYGFLTAEDALAAYIARMAGYSVSLRSGDCQRGTAGDRAWAPGDGESLDLPMRIGCFLDENGTANVRVICGAPGEPGPVRYIGILGAATDLLALTGWAERYPENPEQPVRTAPGICVNDALPEPDGLGRPPTREDWRHFLGAKGLGALLASVGIASNERDVDRLLEALAAYGRG